MEKTKESAINKLGEYAYWISFLTLPIVASAVLCKTVNYGLDTFQRITNLKSNKKK